MSEAEFITSKNSTVRKCELVVARCVASSLRNVQVFSLRDYFLRMILFFFLSFVSVRSLCLPLFFSQIKMSLFHSKIEHLNGIKSRSRGEKEQN